MENRNVHERLQRVVNTLAATKVRVDQEETANRMRACMRELMELISELEDGEEEDGE